MARAKRESPIAGMVDVFCRDHLNESIPFSAVLNGMIFIHLGDDSVFVAKRAKAPKDAKRKKRGN